MFKLRNRPRKISAKRFVKSILTNNYQLKYPQARQLVKMLLPHRVIVEAVKQELNFGWKFVKKECE